MLFVLQIHWGTPINSFKVQTIKICLDENTYNNVGKYVGKLKGLNKGSFFTKKRMIIDIKFNKSCPENSKITVYTKINDLPKT